MNTPNAGPAKPSTKPAAQKSAGEKQYDKTVEDSFPASDPPAHSGVTSDKDPVRTGQK